MVRAYFAVRRVPTDATDGSSLNIWRQSGETWTSFTCDRRRHESCSSKRPSTQLAISAMRPPSFPKQVAGDDLALDLGGALVDPRRPHLAVEVLQQVTLLQRDGAVDLDRGVDHGLGGLGGAELGHRRPAGH